MAEQDFIFGFDTDDFMTAISGTMLDAYSNYSEGKEDASCEN